MLKYEAFPATTTKVMDYLDLKLAVETTPDPNDCMWVYFYRMLHDINESFDMRPSEVRALRDACDRFLANLKPDLEV
jgi:hypothetical protein